MLIDAPPLNLRRLRQVVHGKDVLGDEKLIIGILVRAIRDRWEFLEGLDIIEGETAADEGQHFP